MTPPSGSPCARRRRTFPGPRPARSARPPILLISDGADTCRTPQPCKVAAELAADGVDLHIDTVGFRVAGRAREQLECVAKAGNGRYYDAPDAKALARQLQRAGQLSAAGYRFKGKQVRGTATRNGAPVLVPGQYLDSIGPHEERYYATDLDAASAADLSATAVPPPGAAVGPLDALRTRVARGGDGVCDSTTALFGQREGATPLTVGVSRIPTQRGTGGRDKAGRYRLVVERRAARGSDAARWPLELTFHVEHPLEKGITPAQSAPEYGAGGKGATLPATAPEDVTGGTGFHDAPTLHQGAWRDKVRPAQTLWYKVPVGWGQQLRSDVEFANEPRIQGSSAPASYGRTQVGVVLRAAVLGKEKPGPQAGGSMAAASRRDSGPSADTARDSGGGWSTGRVAAVAVGGVGVAAAGRSRRRPMYVPVVGRPPPTGTRIRGGVARGDGAQDAQGHRRTGDARRGGGAAGGGGCGFGRHDPRLPHRGRCHGSGAAQQLRRTAAEARTAHRQHQTRREEVLLGHPGRPDERVLLGSGGSPARHQGPGLRRQAGHQCPGQQRHYLRHGSQPVLPRRWHGVSDR